MRLNLIVLLLTFGRVLELNPARIPQKYYYGIMGLKNLNNSVNILAIR